MQIVIEIPDNYKDMLGYSNENIDVILRAVKNGTPLPEGHGRLIDADALCDYFWDNRSKLYARKDLQAIIDHAPTIIEADEESENE